MQRLELSYLVCALTVLTLGCSTAPKSESATPQPSPPPQTSVSANPSSSIAERGADIFANAPGLSDEQKKKVMEIYSKTASEAARIRGEIADAKTQIFQKMATARYDSSEIEKLKTKVVGLDRQRLDVMFKALKDVQAVVGFGKDKEEIWRRLRDYDVESRRRTAQSD